MGNEQQQQQKKTSKAIYYAVELCRYQAFLEFMQLNMKTRI